MEARLSPFRQALDDGRLLSMREAAGWRITCEAGRAWLTLEGHSQDKWLAAGERFILPGNGLAVIEADGEARISLQAPPAGGVARLVGGIRTWGRRLARALGGTTLARREIAG